MSLPRLEWRRVLLAIGATIVGLAFCELVLRVAGVEPTSDRELLVRCEAKQRGDDWRCRHMFFQQEHFREDPELMWAPRPGARPFNSLGYRGPVVERHRDADTVRVVAVGDSNTLGPAGTAWPDVLQAELALELQRPVEVLNGGVYGYTSYQGVRRLEQMLDYQPDLVLVSFGSNDALVTADLPDADFARISRTVHHGARQGPRLRTFELLSHWLRQRASNGLVPRVGVDEYRDNLARMVEMARARGAQTILLTRPVVPAYCPLGPQDLGWRAKLPQYNAIVTEVATARGATAVDVNEHFTHRRELFVDESHFTDGGSREMADLLVEPVLGALGEKKKLDRPARRTILLEPPLELPGASAAQPAVAMDLSGRTHIVWIESGPRPGIAYARLTADGQLDRETRLTTTVPSTPGVALAVRSDDQRIAAAWADRDALVWTTSSDGGERFAAPEPAVPDRRVVAPPALTFADGHLWLAWVEAKAANTGEAWVATRSRAGWTPARVGTGLCAGAPVALASGTEPGQVWLAQRGFGESPDDIALRMLQRRDDGIRRDDVQHIAADLPASERCAERAPNLTRGTGTDPLVVFTSETGATRRAMHTTSSCGPSVARVLGADRGPQSRPAVTYVGSGIVVAAWEELSGPVPRIRISTSENGGDWFSSGDAADDGTPDASQTSPALTSNASGELFALTWVRDGRCVVQQGRVMAPPDR